MTYALRERPDGQTEIVLNQPVVVAICPDGQVARNICDLLNEKLDPEAGRLMATVLSPVMSAAATVAKAAVPAVVRTPKLPARRSDGPKPPSFMEPEPSRLTDDQRDQAFRRLSMGEKLAVVAPEFGLSMQQLRGIWARHKRQLQEFHAQGGQIPCKFCARPFTPSESSPDACARCSHE